MSEFPVDQCLPELAKALEQHPQTILHAPPGAGKTTRVPLALMQKPWLSGQKIIMLEPRRLAARSAAIFMAQQLGEQAGETIGYRTRLETKVGRSTRVEVVTEGILTRMLQTDPMLDGIGLVIFDEFHERNLNSDLGLALCLDCQQGLRDDLKLLVMSATLDLAGLNKLMPNAPMVDAKGRQFPIEKIHGSDSLVRLDLLTLYPLIDRALSETDGDVLVFLPGAGEINRTLNQYQPQTPCNLLPLYGDLAWQDQQRIFQPGQQRKVILATAIAETSLTIEGVSAVVDSGFSRLPGFDPVTGMNRLQTLPVSKASAEQRAGRAGRTGPGVCYRPWSQEQHQRLVDHHPPEMVSADLAPMVLEMAMWGVSQSDQLNWITTPPPASFQQAQTLLQELGALDTQGRITPHGQAMASFGTHPRFAHMLIRAKQLELLPEAAALAALLGDRDIFKGRDLPVDLAQRVNVLLNPAEQATQYIDKAVVKRLKNIMKRWCKASTQPANIDQLGLLVAIAYPDRIAKARGSDGRYLLRSGRGVQIPLEDALVAEPYLAVASVAAKAGDSRVFLAASVSEQSLREVFTDQIEMHQNTCWDSSKLMVTASEQERLGALVLSEKPLKQANPEAITAALLEGVREQSIAKLPWNKESQALLQRMRFARQFNSELPDVSEQALADNLEHWLAPHLNAMRKWDQLQKLNMQTVLLGMLSWNQQQWLDQLAPARFAVPSGSLIHIDYAQAPPVLAARIQEVFGLTENPTVADGKVALMVHLLSPAQRPVQVTQDLVSFWNNTYQQVKKDLKGRYPKHYWPDDPSQAQAIRGVKPREKR